VGIGRYRDAKDLPPTTVRGRLADDVRKRRHTVGLSQEAFAKACNVPVRTFKRFEAGSCDSMMVLLKILKAFGRFDGLELLFEEEMPRLEARTLLAIEAQLQAKVKASKLKRK
jgi:predicted transcriptional regulator